MFPSLLCQGVTTDAARRIRILSCVLPLAGATKGNTLEAARTRLCSGDMTTTGHCYGLAAVTGSEGRGRVRRRKISRRPSIFSQSGAGRAAGRLCNLSIGGGTGEGHTYL